MKKRKLATWITALTPVLVAGTILGVASAASITTPHVFEPNTVALASEVNANFRELAEAISDNDARIGEIEKILGPLEAIAAMEARIAELEKSAVKHPDGATTLISGVVNPNGSTQADSGGAFTVNRVQIGVFEIRVPFALSAAGVLAVPAITSLDGGIVVQSLYAVEDPDAEEQVYTVNLLDLLTGDPADAFFTFLMLGTPTGE